MISTLSQVSAGLASGLVGDSTASGIQGAEIGKRAVENNYLYANEAKERAEIEAKLKQADLSESERSALITRRTKLNVVDKERDEAYTQACYKGMTTECASQLLTLSDAFHSYDSPSKEIRSQGTFSEYREVAEKYAEAKRTYMEDVAREALVKITKENVVSSTELISITAKAATGDKAAQSQLKEIGKAIKTFASSPLASISSTVKGGLAEADALELQGRTREADLKRMEVYLSTELGVVSMASGFASLLKSGLSISKKVSKMDYPSSGMEAYVRQKVGDVDYPREAGQSNVNAIRLKEQLSNEMLNKQGVKHQNIDVIARIEIDGKTYIDTNQRARAEKYANPNKPTLIAESVASKPPMKDGSPRPNGNMAEAHAEIGAIQQAYERGVTQGKDMVIYVQGKDVCGHCRQDIALAAEKAGLKSITVHAVDKKDNPVIYDWKPTMKSIKLRKE